MPAEPSAEPGATNGLRIRRSRRGHTKSKRGCFNCKRRRIKCQEALPECDNCTKSGLQCEYPVVAPRSSERAESPQQLVSLQATPGSFSLSDMRLFHHFLIVGYPHLPVGADKIWTTVIPAFAHQYDYLIHSLLALSASYLAALSADERSVDALSHRTVAINLLNNALSKPAKSRSESDARMATALALAFQATHMQDGLVEFLTMIRGCQLIANNDMLMDPESAFYTFRPESHLGTMIRRLNAVRVPPIDPTLLDSALASINAVQPLCSSGLEMEYHQRLEEAARFAYTSPVEAYTSFTALYSWPGRWSNASFQTFVSPDNSVAQILIAHFIALQYVLHPILAYERLGCEQVFAPTEMTTWMDTIQKTVSDNLQPHLEWPLAVRGFVRQLTLSEAGSRAPESAPSQ